MHFRRLLAAAACCALCSCSSNASVAGDAGGDAGIDAGVDAGRDGGPDAGVDAGQDAGLDAGLDAGTDGGPNEDAGNVLVTFLVPSGGGTVQVTGSQVYNFTFPSDVGGESFTIEVLPSDSYGFDAGQYVDIFKLGPNGTQFATPVFVAPEDATNLPNVAFLYPEPVVPAGAEILFAADGGYFITHFSAYAEPAPPSRFCTFDVSAGGDILDYCVPYTYTPIGGWVGGDAVGMTGMGDVTHDPCTMPDTCMEVTCWSCVDAAGETDWKKGDRWCPSGSAPYAFVEVDADTSCPTDPAPPGCQRNDGKISATGCGFITTCSGVPLHLSCSGGTCSCSGGSSSATFPQGATCANTSNGFAALDQHCP